MLFLTRLALTNFRNYDRFVWEPAGSLTVLTGPNGSGKTNLLEALSLLTPGRGLRGAKGAEFLRRSAHDGVAGWGVAGRFQDSGGSFEIATGTETAQTDKRRVLLDGRPLSSRSAVADYLSAVWITPQMDRLFNDSPGGRRRFLDRLAVALAPHHASELSAFERASAQRNRLLSGPERADPAWLAGIEDAMARHSVAIVAARADLVRRLNAVGADPAGIFPSAGMFLICPIAERLTQEPALRVEDWIRDELRGSRELDRVRGRASTGAGRADFGVRDSRSGLLASEGSTGQQKTVLIAIILAHARLLAGEGQTAPLLLLDEPLVHLDEQRRQALLEMLPSFRSPVLMTGTDQEPFHPLAGRADFVSLRDGRLINTT